MKKYSRKIEEVNNKVKLNHKKGVVINDHEACKLIRKQLGAVGKWDANAKPLMSSQDFLDKWSPFIEEIALFRAETEVQREINKKRKSEGKKAIRSFRSLDYAAIGIMDKHDLMQEANLAFLDAWNKADWNKIKNADSPGAMLWSYVRRTTNLNLARAIRELKDGMRIPEWFYLENKNVKTITSLFEVLGENLTSIENSVSISKYDKELLNSALRNYMSLYLNDKEIDVLVNFFGLNSESMSYNEMADFYGVSSASLRKTKERAINKLIDSNEFREEMDYFIKSYRIDAQANIGFNSKKPDFIETFSGYESQSKEKHAHTIMKDEDIVLEFDNLTDYENAFYKHLNDFIKYTDSGSYESFKYMQYWLTGNDDYLLKPVNWRVKDCDNHVISSEAAVQIKNKIRHKELGFKFFQKEKISDKEFKLTTVYDNVFKWKGDPNKYSNDQLVNMDLRKTGMTAKKVTYVTSTKEPEYNPTDFGDNDDMFSPKADQAAKQARNQYGAELGTIGNSKIPFGI